MWASVGLALMLLSLPSAGLPVVNESPHESQAGDEACRAEGAGLLCVWEVAIDAAARGPGSPFLPPAVGPAGTTWDHAFRLPFPGRLEASLAWQGPASNLTLTLMHGEPVHDVAHGHAGGDRLVTLERTILAPADLALRVGVEDAAVADRYRLEARLTPAEPGRTEMQVVEVQDDGVWVEDPWFRNQTRVIARETFEVAEPGLARLEFDVRTGFHVRWHVEDALELPLSSGVLLEGGTVEFLLPPRLTFGTFNLIVGWFDRGGVELPGPAAQPRSVELRATLTVAPAPAAWWEPWSFGVSSPVLEDPGGDSENQQLDVLTAWVEERGDLLLVRLRVRELPEMAVFKDEGPAYRGPYFHVAWQQLSSNVTLEARAGLRGPLLRALVEGERGIAETPLAAFLEPGIPGTIAFVAPKRVVGEPPPAALLANLSAEAGWVRHYYCPIVVYPDGRATPCPPHSDFPLDTTQPPFTPLALAPAQGVPSSTGSNLVPLDAYLKAAAALVTLAFAVLILHGGPRKTSNQFLAAFFLLLAANQAAETLRALATSPEEVAHWFRFATVFAALDPVALFYFASVYPERGRWNAALPIAAVTAGAAALAFTAFGLVPFAPGESRLAAMALSLFTGAVYLAVLGYALRQLAASPAAPERRLLVAALCFAVLPVAYRLARTVATLAAVDTLGASSGLGTPLEHVLAFAGFAVVVALLAAALARSGTFCDLHLPWAGFLGAIGLTLFLNLGHITNFLLAIGAGNYPPGPVLDALARAGAALRWLLFGALLSLALLRYDMLGVSLRARRRSARVVVGAAFVGAAASLLVAVPLAVGDVPEASPLSLGGLLLAVVVSQRFVTVVDRVAVRLYGVPAQGTTAALEAYRGAVVQAAREGRNPRTDSALVRLREELGVDHGVAAVLARMAEGDGRGPLAAGRVVAGRYRVERLLGRGGSGRAFLAQDELLGGRVVLKEALGSAPEDGADIRREAELTREVEHANVVRVVDVVDREEGAVLVLEYVPGGSLGDRLRGAGAMLPSEAARIVGAVLEGLDAIHRRGIVHRDLKPDNVLLTSDGVPKITDFGIARQRRGNTMSFDEPDEVRGTLEFMAPEQRAGALASPAADIYAAGLLLRRCASRLPPAMEAVAARATAHDPADRWPSAEAMRQALRA